MADATMWLQNPAYSFRPTLYLFEKMTNWKKIAKHGVTALYLVVALALLLAFYTYGNMPVLPSEEGAGGNVLHWKSIGTNVQTAAASVQFRPAGGRGTSKAPTGPLSSRFRLAGTFLQYGAPGEDYDKSRKAILDDLKRKTQELVEEGDVYQGVNVVRISKDHVLLEDNGVEEELWLSFRSSSRKKDDKKKIGTDSATGRQHPSDSESNPFGKRVGENRWVFEKEALRDFYQEMMDNPARAVDVYETMRPNYDSEDNITGYTVDVVGEKQFFDAVGLQNGDVVRRVNSMKMTSRNSAEYFMKEFMKDRLNAVVLDIEREGDKKKQIYLLR